MILAAFLATLLVQAPQAKAHDLSFTETVVLLKSDGTFVVDMTVDLDALALGAPPMADAAELKEELEALSPEALAKEAADLQTYFERRVRVFFDGEPVDFSVRFPARGTVLTETSEGPTHFGLLARLEGRIPENATTFSFRASRSFPPTVLSLLRQEDAGVRQVLQKGSPSDPVPLVALEPSEGDAFRARLDAASSYLVLGFWHILPAGLDHILFVLGLFLLSVRWRPLLWQVSAFTLAHTITLALATYDVVQLPSKWVEALIALSIAYVAVENIVTTDLKPWRPWVVFAFGLLHGLGFAGVLGELGLPRQHFVTALVSFNIGVEVGQLVVLGIAFAVLGWWREKPWFRTRIVIPISLLIALVGLYWAVERALG